MSNILFEFRDTEGKEAAKIDVKLLYISKAIYEEDWHSTMHTHYFTELFYVVHGSGSFQIENMEFEVKENDLVIVNPHVSHTESSKEADPLEYIVIGIDGLALTTEDDSKDSNNINLYSVHNYSKYKQDILYYMNNLLSEVQKKDEHYEAICQNLIEVLILNVKRRTKSNLLLSPTKSINKECAFIKNYIDIHYSSDLNLDSLAAITHINKYYLVHVFKKFMGTSPIDYLIEKRVSVAKTLLETTNCSIEQISEIVGFSSQSYFNQIFKKRTGTSPTAYRKQYNEKKH